MVKSATPIDITQSMTGTVTMDVDKGRDSVTMILPDGKYLVMTELETEAMAKGLWTCLTRLRRRQINTLLAAAEAGKKPSHHVRVAS